MTTMNVIAEISESTAAARETARQRYVELIMSDDAKPDELEEVMAALKKSPSAAAADVQAIKLAADLQKRVDGAKGIGAEVDASITALEVYSAESQRIAQERQQGRLELLQAQKALTDRAGAAEVARSELAKLQQLHPDVLPQ